MAADRFKYATILPRCSEQTTWSNVFKIEENMHRHSAYLKLILKEFIRKKECKIEKYQNIVKLSQPILVRSYSFADIMTRDKYVAFKIVSCSTSWNFI